MPTPPRPCGGSQSCLFCCTPLARSNRHKRCRQLKNIGAFVLEHCRPTNFFYQRIVSIDKESRHPLCLPCVNWQRRCTQGPRKRCQGQKPFLLVDHFALFMLEPGKVSAPDQRCALRLVQALLDGHGRFVSAYLPVPVQCMLTLLKPRAPLTVQNLLTHLVSAWWSYNGCTPFMAHHLTAKLVRRMVKDTEKEEGVYGEET
jgi:hypothetical protein